MKSALEWEAEGPPGCEGPGRPEEAAEPGPLSPEGVASAQSFPSSPASCEDEDGSLGA